MTIKPTIFFLVFVAFFLSITSCTEAQIKKEYFENGNIKSKIRYKDGVKNGEAIIYFQNGVIAEEFIYINDKKEGLFKVYYENGNLENQGYYNNGELDGMAYSFTESGDTIFKREYLNGKTQTDIRYENNKPFRIMDFVNQKMIVYNEDGTVKDTVALKKK